jgi:hypothetical protein
VTLRLRLRLLNRASLEALSRLDAAAASVEFSSLLLGDRDLEFTALGRVEACVLKQHLKGPCDAARFPQQSAPVER